MFLKLVTAALLASLAAYAQGLSANPSFLFASPPAAAVAAGYTVNTFSSYLLPADIDTAQTYPAGKKWYFSNFYSVPPAAANTITFLSPYGVTVGSNGVVSNLSTVGISGASWHGTAFGGGFYWEAVAYWNHNSVVTANASGGWPVIWMQTVEHAAGLAGQQWTGQAAGYQHFIEPDLMEDDLLSFAPGYIGMTTHDFWGIYNVTCSNFCQVSTSSGGGSAYTNNQVLAPASTNVYHRYGMLWIPATGSTSGTLTYYLDGVATSSAISWTQYVAGSDSPPPGAAPWTFGVIDGQHVFPNLSTGNNQPMTVGYVAVWQKSAANNLQQ